MLSPFPTHASLWWRSGIRIEGTRLVPVPPFVPYNPFDSYFPIETATREQRSLPYLLLDVDYEDIQAVARFCERFGVLGNFQNVGWAQWAAESGLVYPVLATGQSPQHAKEPSPRMTHDELPPVTRCCAELSPETLTGAVAAVLEPPPSWPLVFAPQHETLPVLSRAHA